MSHAHLIDLDEEARFPVAFAAALASMTDTAGAIALDWMPSPVGLLLLGATDRAVVLVEFASLEQLDKQLARLRKQLGHGFRRDGEQALLMRLKAQLEEYFAGTRRRFDLPLEFHGSPFQERVWSTLREIPYGETRSYGAIARTVGDLKATRAVGMANGANPLAIVIPCHRVVNANGDLGGFGGGRWRKEWLLDLERGQQRLF